MHDQILSINTTALAILQKYGIWGEVCDNQKYIILTQP